MAVIKRGFLVAILTLAGIISGVVVTALIVDIHNDRQYTVKVTGKLHVYDSETPPGYTRGEEGVIETLRPPDRVPVLRIISHDEVQAIRVQLPDGRQGYIFCCQNFEFSK